MTLTRIQEGLTSKQADGAYTAKKRRRKRGTEGFEEDSFCIPSA
jgi:hypothetical protein